MGLLAPIALFCLLDIRLSLVTTSGSQPVVAGKLHSGLNVTICGLQRQKQYNGHSARVLRFNETTGRYTLRLSGGPRVQVDATHLVDPRAEPSRLLSAVCQRIEGPGSLTTAFSATHPVVDNEIFHEGCSEACDHCFAEYLMNCYSYCHYGCQVYCNESTAGMPGCSTNEYWSAQPGGMPDCVFDIGQSPMHERSCRKYRNCGSETSDGCPEVYLYD
mmetsp:Transcript_112887/g.205150  ORF Transcript_112887/g.205150 Transcript_112887/m.205150 type:complete len:217 (+) Transcript_112887:119-769(+)